ncbi:MAG: LptF/LptG family permease, partial [Clostridia bacterium]|nr:LptF/LptG family permease [Clostridia bacterium]
LQFHSGDRLRSWYFGQFYDDGMQEKVTLKIFDQKEFVEKALPEFIRTQDYVIDTKNNNLLLHVIVAEKTFYDEENATWMLFKPVIGVTSYSYKITKKKVEISNSKIPYAISANLFAKYYGFKTDSEFLDFPKIREDVSTRMTNQEAAEWLAENHTSWPEDKKLLDDLLVRFEEAVSQDSKNAVSDELAPSGNDKPLERVFKRLAQTVSEAKKKPNIVIPAKLPDDKTRCRTILDIILKGIPNEKIDNLVSSVEYEEVLSDLRGKLDLSKDDLDILAFYDNEAKDASREMDERVYESSLFQESQVSSGRDVLAWEKDRDPVLLLVSEKVIPDKPSVIVKSVIEPEALSSYEIFRILMDNPHMSKSLKHIYETIFFNRLAFPWACFLCAFFALPLATKNERSGIFTAIATAVGIAVFYQVLNEIFMVIGKNGYLSFDLIEDFIHFPLGACLAGLAPTIIFGGYGIYLLKKVG